MSSVNAPLVWAADVAEEVITAGIAVTTSTQTGADLRFSLRALDDVVGRVLLTGMDDDFHIFAGRVKTLVALIGLYAGTGMQSMAKQTGQAPHDLLREQIQLWRTLAIEGGNS
jgi:hypothetical protein